MTRASSGATFLSVGREGTLAFVKGARENTRTLVWVSDEGVETPLDLPPASYSTPRISPDGTRVAFTVTGNLGSGDLFIVDSASQVYIV